MNPLVLNFRGNALSQLGRFREALQDYREATEIFRKDGWAGPEFGSGQKANLLGPVGRHLGSGMCRLRFLKYSLKSSEIHFAMTAS